MKENGNRMVRWNDGWSGDRVHGWLERHGKEGQCPQSNLLVHGSLSEEEGLR